MKKDKILIPLDGGEPIFHAPAANVTQNHDTRYPSSYKKLANYTLQWRNRLLMESTASPCMFVTFTFDPEHYFENDQENVTEQLKHCWQSFRKRLEWNLKIKRGITGYKYYVVSERGEDGRLHYHALLFGFPYKSFRTKRNGKWVAMVEFNEYTDIIDKSWGLGFVTYEAVNDTAIKYVTKYIHKRKESGDYINLKSNGIGLAFLDEAKKKFFKENDQCIYHIGKRTVFLPRYLKQKIWTDPEEYKAMTERLMEKISNRESALCKQSVPKGDLLVTIRQSELLLRSTLTDFTDLRINYGTGSVTGTEVQDLLDRCGVVYDPDDDSFQIIFFYYADDPLVWYRQRKYTEDSYRMKTVYNRRL